jgi:HEXXH motif-containing protein
MSEQHRLEQTQRLRGIVWFEVAPVYATRPDFRRDFAGYADAPLDHTNIVRAVELVERWPYGAAQAKRVISALHPAYEPGLPVDTVTDPVISSSHSYEDSFGTLWATVNSTLGLAEALVHETAHHKLRALGVRFESADTIVANVDGHLYPSPLLGGRPRPMPALVHGHYALLHMVVLELALLRSRDTGLGPILVRLLARNLTLLAQSDALLRRHLVVDKLGVPFMQALSRWQRALTEAGLVYR